VVEVPTWAQNVKISVSLLFPPKGRLTRTVPEGGPFQNGSSRQTQSQHRKSDNNSHPSTSIVNVKMPAPRFITFRLKDTEKNMRNIDPFSYRRHGMVDGIPGKVKKRITYEELNTT
jgi:hypothetical protein